MAVTPMKDELMVQQQIQGEWQHMVAVMCLNQTYRKQSWGEQTYRSTA